MTPNMSICKSSNAAAAGQFKVGGDININRLGFGAMRITGPGIWGDPSDRPEALRLLRRLPEPGVNFIDTADSYGPETSENLICEALHPFDGLLIATKGGMVRHGPDKCAPVGRPEYLRQAVLMSLRRLGIQRIDLWHLHRIDPKVPRDEQLDAVRAMQQEGLIRHVGLSAIGIEDIEAAQKFFKVATVQNLFNLVDRSSEAVLDYCEANGIGFIPFRPLATGQLGAPASILADPSQRVHAMPIQIALAWTLRRSPVMLPIPGTSKVKQFEQNVAAASINLPDQDFQVLDEQGRKAWQNRPS